MQNRNIVSIVVALLGAAKLVLQAFGVQISEADINAVANAVAAVVTLYGVIATHLRKDFPVNKQAQPPAQPPTQ